MMHAILLLLAAAITPPNSAQDAGIAAARDYSSCVGMAAVLNSATMPIIDEAVSAAFDRCAAKRETTRTALTAGLETFGLTAVRAAQEADQMIRENDQMLADRLKADIATFRRTGHPPANAPN
jgi:hypothetical protein